MNNIATEDNFVLDKFTAIDFLLNGSGRTILLNDISWEEYELFLNDFEERAGWRLAFDKGKLEIMPPTLEHDHYSFSFHNFVLAYCDEFEITLEGAGSTTFRRQFLKKGVEPDECFYIQSAEKIIGLKFDSKEYPAPDIAVEIDVTTESLDKFPIYAALEVPEVWIYDGEKVSFYQLEAESYHQTANSCALPLLSAEKLTEVLEISKTKGQTSSLRHFRKWLSTQRTA